MIVCETGSLKQKTEVDSKYLLLLLSEQRAILRRALELLDKKGQVLYCTTSYNPVENEAVIMSLLKETEGKWAC